MQPTPSGVQQCLYSAVFGYMISSPTAVPAVITMTALQSISIYVQTGKHSL